MKIKFVQSLLVPLLFCLSSCFEVVEEINSKADGSGEMITTLNLSQSKSKIASVMLLDSINGYKIPNKQELLHKLDEAVVTLKSVRGISAVRYTADFNNYIITLRFSFDNAASLNRISQIIFNKLKLNASGSSFYSFDEKTKTFSRNYQYLPEAGKAFQKLKTEDRAVFKDATYTSIYRFADPVVRQSNKLAKLSASKKAVMLRTGMLNLVNGKVNITNHIQLSK